MLLPVVAFSILCILSCSIQVFAKNIILNHIGSIADVTSNISTTSGNRRTITTIKRRKSCTSTRSIPLAFGCGRGRFSASIACTESTDRHRKKYSLFSATSPLCTTSIASELDPEEERWRNKLIEWVDDRHGQSSTKCHLFEIEKEDVPPHYQQQKYRPFTFEWIEGSSSLVGKEAGRGKNEKDTKKIAIRTINNGTKENHDATGPLLDIASVARLREAAQHYWYSKKATGSRFTLQFDETNSECHLEELIALDKSGTLKSTIDNLLQNKIYPLVRTAFGEELDHNHHHHHQQPHHDSEDHARHATRGTLCVYDSLVIRYNGDKAKDQKYGASQPLHRDGGMISVNIALNSMDEFEGGGTFFEGLLESPRPYNFCSISDQDPVLRPLGIGHAIAHLSTERHTGAPTRKGIREILVFFLTLRPYHSHGLPRPRAPPMERAFHLKLVAKEIIGHPSSRALICLEEALKERPMDGEVHFWKGFYLLNNHHGHHDGGTHEKNNDIIGSQYHQDPTSHIHKSIHHMQRAQEYAPFDARIHCFLGIAYKRMVDIKYRSSSSGNTSENPWCEIHHKDRLVLEEAVKCFQNAIYLHDQYQQYGISSDFDVVSAILSLSEVLSRLEKYEQAIGYIALLQDSNTQGLNEELLEHVNKHANAIKKYCKDMLRHKSLSNSSIGVE
jgi:tetratricopeptide (TPR) repeat protein